MENKEVEKCILKCKDGYLYNLKIAKDYIEQLEKENTELKKQDKKSQILVNESYLYDWYIHSVDKSIPVWTVEHINELSKDFDIYFKNDKSKELKELLAYQCSELNTMNDKLLDNNEELKQQLQTKDKALDKACHTLVEVTQECPYDATGCEVFDCCGCCNNIPNINDCWKTWCENEY